MQLSHKRCLIREWYCTSLGLLLTLSKPLFLKSSVQSFHIKLRDGGETKPTCVLMVATKPDTFVFSPVKIEK